MATFAGHENSLHFGIQLMLAFMASQTVSFLNLQGLDDVPNCFTMKLNFYTENYRDI